MRTLWRQIINIKPVIGAIDCVYNSVLSFQAIAKGFIIAVIIRKPGHTSRDTLGYALIGHDYLFKHVRQSFPH